MQCHSRESGEDVDELTDVLVATKFADKDDNKDTNECGNGQHVTW